MARDGRREKPIIKLTTEDQDSVERRRKYAMINIGLVCFVILMSGMVIYWTLNDITGEYAGDNRSVGLVRMSLIRKAANIKGELSYGSGSILEMETEKIDPDKVSFVFHVPEKWVEKQGQRQVKFHGKIHDGIVSGVIQDGIKVYAVKLQRNGLASLYRQVQSHLPFAS